MPQRSKTTTAASPPRPRGRPRNDDGDAAPNADGSRGAVARTVSVLRAFTSQSKWGVRELAAELKIPKSGLHRTLQELAAEGLLRGDESGAYEISAELLHLAAEISRSVDLTRVALPHLRAASQEGGETTVLVTYDPQRRQITGVEAAETSNPIQFAWHALRQWIDLHHSASGLGILAFLEPAEIDQVLDGPLLGVDGKRVDVKALRAQLAEIRVRGWAATCNARIPDSCGVCAPVYDATERVIGGVVIAWPQRRHSDHDAFEQKLGKLARDTANAISADLGATSHGRG